MSASLRTMPAKGPGVTLSIIVIDRLSEMRPGFSQCAILQCDTTRIGQDAPCGAMPKPIHPSTPAPWAPTHAVQGTFPSTLENLAGPGRARGVPGRESAPGPTRKGPNGQVRVESSRVESSRVESGWLTDMTVCQRQRQRQCQCQCQVKEFLG